MCAEYLLEGVWVCWVQFIGQIVVWQIAINQEPEEDTRQGNDKDIYYYYYGRKEQAVWGGWLQKGADTGVE